MRRTDPRPRPVGEGYWFARKRCGIGATPATWQGWLLSAIFIALLLLAVFLLPNDVAKGTAAFALIAIFMTISWMKTDGGWGWTGCDD
jgi:hypothetical protein